MIGFKIKMKVSLSDLFDEFQRWGINISLMVVSTLTFNLQVSFKDHLIRFEISQMGIDLGNRVNAKVSFEWVINKKKIPPCVDGFLESIHT